MPKPPCAHSGSPRRGHDPAEYEDAFAANDDWRAVRRGRRRDGGLFYRPVGQAAGRGFRGWQPPATWPRGQPLCPPCKSDGTRMFRPEPPLVCRGKRKPSAYRHLPRARDCGSFGGLLPVASRRRRRHLPAAHPWRRIASRISPGTRQNSSTTFPRLVGSRMSIEDVVARQSLWTDGHGQIRRPALDDDRCPGPVVPDRNRGGQKSLGRSGIASSTLPGGRRPIQSHGSKGSATRAAAQRRRYAAGNPLVRNRNHGLAEGDGLHRSGSRPSRLRGGRRAARRRGRAHAAGPAHALVGQLRRRLQDPLPGHRQHLGPEVLHPRGLAGCKSATATSPPTWSRPGCPSPSTSSTWSRASASAASGFRS